MNSNLAFNALGDPTRRAIFEKLQHRPMAVVDIADGLPISRPAVSQHLKVLKEAKLINLKTVGNNNIYELNRESIIAMRNYLDKFWDEALANFKALAEQTEKKEIMETINLTSIKKEFLVEASQQTAFEVFTQKIDLWWPRTHHIGSSDLTEMVVEPRVGGRWYSKHTDGSEADTGYVLTYQPYDLLVLAWQIDGDFKCNPDLVTEVVVEFIPESSKHTRVKFEHKDLHKLGSGKTVESMDKGWGDIMNLYKQFADR